MKYILSEKITIKASKVDTWKVISDIGAVSEYVPDIQFSKWTSDGGLKVGAGRYCEFDTQGKQNVNETVLAVGDNSFTIGFENVSGLPKMMKGLEIVFKVEDTPERQTQVTVDVFYKGNIFSTLMVLMGKSKFRKMFRTFLTSLKKRVENQ